MHWPGASLMTVIGFTLSIPSVIIYLITRYKSKENAKLGTIGAYMFVISVGCGLTLFKGISASKNLLNSFMDVSRGNEMNSNNLQKLVNHHQYEKYKDVRVETQLLVDLIRFHKNVLIENSGGTDQMGNPLGKDNQDIAAQYFLVDNNGENGTHLSESINSLHDKYTQYYDNQLGVVMFQKAEERQTYYGGYESWGSRTFEHLPLAAVVSTLSSLENTILGAELNLFNHLDTQVIRNSIK